MKEFMKKHPALADACDTVLSLLSGGFALLAVGFNWIKELVGRKKRKAIPCTLPVHFWTA